VRVAHKSPTCLVTAGSDTLLVIAGLVPVIPTTKSAAPHSIEMAGTRPAMTGEGVTRDSGMRHRALTVPARSSSALGPSDVITGLMPVIPMRKSAAPHRIEMAGTDPRIKSGDGRDGEGVT
jgi:hypothetical protein